MSYQTVFWLFDFKVLDMSSSQCEWYNNNLPPRPKMKGMAAPEIGRPASESWLKAWSYGFVC